MFGYHKYYTIIQVEYSLNDDNILEFHMISVWAKNPFKAIARTVKKIHCMTKEALLDDLLINAKLYSTPFSQEEWNTEGKEKYNNLTRQYSSYIKI